MFMLLRSVLILEDESLLSITIEDLLRELGAEEVLSFADHEEAAGHAQSASIDCAVLDVMIQGRPNFEIADILDDRGIPFVFSSGLSLDDVEDRHRHRPFLSKPFSDDELKNSILAAIERKASRAAAGTDPAAD